MASRKPNYDSILKGCKLNKNKLNYSRAERLSLVSSGLVKIIHLEQFFFSSQTLLKQQSSSGKRARTIRGFPLKIIVAGVYGGRKGTGFNVHNGPIQYITDQIKTIGLNRNQRT